MVNMIVLTEVFICIKHGQNSFSHASIPKLGYVFLALLTVFYLTILVKVLISDVINYKKAKKNEVTQKEYKNK